LSVPVFCRDVFFCGWKRFASVFAWRWEAEREKDGETEKKEKTEKERKAGAELPHSILVG
jgi:hypothetical protein